MTAAVQSVGVAHAVICGRGVVWRACGHMGGGDAQGDGGALHGRDIRFGWGDLATGG